MKKSHATDILDPPKHALIWHFQAKTGSIQFFIFSRN